MTQDAIDTGRIRQLTEEKLAWMTCPELSRFMGPVALRRAFEEEATANLEREQSTELAELFLRHCPVDGARVEDYHNEMFSLPSGLELMMGIRFRALNMDYPFVEVLHLSRPFSGAGELSAAFSLAMSRYSMFKPLAIRVYYPEHLKMPQWQGAIETNNHLLAAPAADMVSHGVRWAMRGLELRPPKVSEFMEDYQRDYQEMWEERPELRGVVQVEDRETLTQLVKEGGLYSIHVEGAWAGIVGVSENTAHGVCGSEMQEIMLCKQYRGRGLAPLVHTRLAHKVMESHPKAVLWGTISPQNRWSLRAATAAGRVRIGTDRYLLGARRGES